MIPILKGRDTVHRLQVLSIDSIIRKVLLMHDDTTGSSVVYAATHGNVSGQQY